MTILGMGCMFLAASPLVLAQAETSGSSDKEQSPSADQLKTMVVTADRFVSGGNQPVPAYAGGKVAVGGRMGVLGEQRAFDTPFNVISYTSKKIEDSQAQTLGDVLRYDPSVQVGAGFGNYSQYFRIRGYEVQGDDISYGGLYGILPRQVISPIGAERIEVFKGANAFVNGVPPGGGGVGGAINVEPKRAGDKPLARTTVGYATDGYLYSSVDAGRRFGTNNEWGVRVNALRGSGDSPVNGNDDTRNNAFSLALDYRGERVRSAIDFGYQKDIFDGVRSTVLPGTTLTSMPHVPSSRTNYTPEWSYSKLESTYGMWTGEYDFADNWTGYAGVGFNKTHEFGDYVAPHITSENGDSTLSNLITAHDEKHFTSQAGVRGKFNTGPLSHSVNLGYSGYVVKSYSGYEMTGSTTTNIYDPVSNPDVGPVKFSGGSMSAPGLTARTRANGISLSDTVGLFDDKLRLTAGVRYQQLTVRNWGYDHSPSSDFHDNGFTPVYGFVYQPVDYLSFYANYIQALQQGPSVPTTGGYDNAGQTLGIVRSKQYETGIKLDFGNVGGSLSAFHIEQPNASGMGSVYALNGKQTNKGIEAMVYGEPLNGWTVTGGVTWIDSELKGTTNGQYNGHDAIGVPKYTATVTNDWAVPGVDGLFLMGNVIRTGSQYADQNNKLRLKPWTRLDLGARYSTIVGNTPMTWRAEVDNVTNNNYWDAAGSSSSGNIGYVSMGLPRVFKVSMSVDL